MVQRSGMQLSLAFHSASRTDRSEHTCRTLYALREI